MQFAKHQSDKDASWMEGNSRFERMDLDTASLIKTVTGANIPIEKGESINMWTGWKNWIDQARNAGFADGRNAGFADGRNADFADGRNVGKIDMAITFAKKYNIPAEEAIKTAGISKAEWDAYERSKVSKNS